MSSPHDGVNRLRELPPLVLLRHKTPLPFACDLINAASPSRLLRPSAREQTGALEAMERWIQSPFREIERAAALEAEPFRDCVAMGGARFQRGE
jgi:hypothetical protein